jgi:hypothetical protein
MRYSSGPTPFLDTSDQVPCPVVGPDSGRRVRGGHGQGEHDGARAGETDVDVNTTGGPAMVDLEDFVPCYTYNSILKVRVVTLCILHLTNI